MIIAINIKDYNNTYLSKSLPKHDFFNHDTRFFKINGFEDYSNHLTINLETINISKLESYSNLHRLNTNVILKLIKRYKNINDILCI